MPPVITNLAPETETEAVNLMLRQIGEQPVSDATTSVLADVVMALDILKETTREALSEGWKFNTEFGLRLNPTSGSPFVWTDPDSTTLSINVFTPPTGLLAFKTSRTAVQQCDDLDLTLRKSKQYVEGSPTPAAVQVFYDRARNRDGLDRTKYTFIHIDPVWYMDYEDLPQEARRYIAIRAARIFTQNVPGSEKLSAFTSDDEVAALRQIKRRYGRTDKFNQFRGAEAQGRLGYPFRNPGIRGFSDPRSTP